jgi:hypothetical protein
LTFYVHFKQYCPLFGICATNTVHSVKHLYVRVKEIGSRNSKGVGILLFFISLLHAKGYGSLHFRARHSIFPLLLTTENLSVGILSSMAAFHQRSTRSNCFFGTKMVNALNSSLTAHSFLTRYNHVLELSSCKLQTRMGRAWKFDSKQRAGSKSERASTGRVKNVERFPTVFFMGRAEKGGPLSPLLPTHASSPIVKPG